MPSHPSEEVTAVLGDAAGAYGVDFVSPYEYGELLLLDEEGGIERAYPMTAFPPNWLLITPEAVYVGKVGDGGLPWSAVGRIDRATLKSHFVISPTPGSDYEYWPTGWTFVHDGYDNLARHDG